ncbi:hypothetical protein [Paenibacillus oleatilyticus]|uniref:hypothetical protein n=1 Tax=Paenibacillus oleatilyticus TaxID=2594886 RepID=UPI001C1FE48A|nr:hypothetical protein [Paenibacillus oleatilyticus]MBU7317777.1 hypothetical protein [Paenibacillus oleatilyticus]
MAVKIQLRDTEIVFDDIVELTDEQLQLIISTAKSKTEKQWLNPDTRGIKIRLSPEQKASVLGYKNQLVNGHTPQTLIDHQLLRFTDHGLKRIAARIDRDAFPSERALLGIADIVIQSQKIENDAEWRGYGCLSYNLNGEYNGKTCTVSIVFDGPILVITVITDEPNPTTYTMSALLPADTMEKLEIMREASKQKPHKDRR